MVNQYRKLPFQGGNPRDVAEIVNNLVEGKINSTGTVTLATGGAETTTIVDRRIGPDSVILLMPTTVAAAAINNYPYGTFQQRADVTFTTANTPQVLTLTETEYAYGMSLASNRITVGFAGIYDIDVSALFANCNSSIQNAWIWVRVNGTDYPHTATKFACTESHGGTDGYTPIAINEPVGLSGGDYIEIVAAVANTDVFLESDAAQTTPFVVPSIPSIAINVLMIDPSGTSDSAFEMYISNRINGQATLNHLPNSIANKTFDYVVLG